MVSVQKRAPESEKLHTDELAAYAQRLSLIANEFPELTDSRAEITLRQADIYRLTSEGVRVAQPQDDVVTIVFDFHLYRKANVGDVNSEHEKKYSTASEALADSARFIRQVRQYVGNRLSTLRDSIAEDYYVGPNRLRKLHFPCAASVYGERPKHLCEARPQDCGRED